MDEWKWWSRNAFGGYKPQHLSCFAGEVAGEVLFISDFGLEEMGHASRRRRESQNRTKGVRRSMLEVQRSMFKKVASPRAALPTQLAQRHRRHGKRQVAAPRRRSLFVAFTNPSGRVKAIELCGIENRCDFNKINVAK